MEEVVFGYQWAGNLWPVVKGRFLPFLNILLLHVLGCCAAFYILEILVLLSNLSAWCMPPPLRTSTAGANFRAGPASLWFLLPADAYLALVTDTLETSTRFEREDIANTAGRSTAVAATALPTNA